MGKKNKIPDRWLIYRPMGEIIYATNFITFKVPLDKNLSKYLPEKSWFTPVHVINYVEQNGYQLGLVIDLTNTDRFYDPQEFKNYGIEHVKIFCPGHVIPGMDVINRFTSVVDRFLRTASSDKLIGVHCTHGLNRTGYLVCRYLIDRLGFSYDDAVSAFNSARTHNIERENYLKDLKKFYDRRMHQFVIPLGRPRQRRHFFFDSSEESQWQTPSVAINQYQKKIDDKNLNFLKKSNYKSQQLFSPSANSYNSWEKNKYIPNTTLETERFKPYNTFPIQHTRKKKYMYNHWSEAP